MIHLKTQGASLISSWGTCSGIGERMSNLCILRKTFYNINKASLFIYTAESVFFFNTFLNHIKARRIRIKIITHFDEKEISFFILNFKSTQYRREIILFHTKTNRIFSFSCIYKRMLGE